MLASFVAWWIARISELMPRSWTSAGALAPDGIVLSADRSGDMTASLRRKGREEAITLGAAARLAGRKTVFLRPPPSLVLEKHHVVPAAARRELGQMLRFELARITPFDADTLFWRWDGQPKPTDKSRIDVLLTMVSKAAVAPALDVLNRMKITPRFIEVGPPERPRLLSTDDAPPAGQTLARGLAWGCAGLAVVALALPVLIQELALRRTDAAIEALQPTINQVQALRRGLTADDAGQTLLESEMQRTGDLLQLLATVTRILPDDTYLTDFSLRDRHMVLGGRSGAAARLIAALSADPAIRDAAFAAPVTRIEGASTDAFSIRADAAP